MFVLLTKLLVLCYAILTGEQWRELSLLLYLRTYFSVFTVLVEVHIVLVTHNRPLFLVIDRNSEKLCLIRVYR